MRRLSLVLISAVSTIAFTQIASSADLGRSAYRPYPLAVWNWSGFYAGVNGGWAWNNTSGDTYCITPGSDIQGVGCTVLPQGNLKPSGGFGGGQIGFNFQLGQFVYGAEADIQGADISDSITISSAGFPIVGGGLTGPASFSQSQLTGLAPFEAGWAGRHGIARSFMRPVESSMAKRKYQSF